MRARGRGKPERYGFAEQHARTINTQLTHTEDGGRAFTNHNTPAGGKNSTGEMKKKKQS
jgi:hypothetical protein